MSTNLKIKSVQDLQEGLNDFLKEIIKTGASSKGDVFDETVKEKLINNLNGAKLINSNQWSSKEKDSLFYEYNKKSFNNDFDFTDLPPIVENGKIINLMIVDKPNGSQKWPDLLVVYNGIGLPIEVKSSKTDGIVWNSGIPRADSLYIYNCYGKSQTTCFLGQHAISEKEYKFLLKKSKLAAAFNEKEEDERWSFYVRDMFNSKQTYFENTLQRTKVLKKQQIELENKLNLISKESKDYSKLSTKLNKVLSEIKEFDKEFETKKKERENIEEETLNYIVSLNWSNSQKTKFNLEE